jgi:hypothetical protein
VLAQVDELKRFFGVREQALEGLLGASSDGAGSPATVAELP